jgi:hypothetical protein
MRLPHDDAVPPKQAPPSQVWTEVELGREFEVIGRAGQCVIVRRRQDNRLGSVRQVGTMYTDWREDFDARD